MKKKLKAELKELAKKLMEEKEFSLNELQDRSREIYEKLTVLKFVEDNLFNENLEEKEPAPERKKEKIINEEVLFPAEAMGSVKYAPEELPEREEADSLIELNTEKIKNIVSQMPDEAAEIPVKPTEVAEKPFNNSFQIDVDYDNLPQFEPKQTKKNDDRPQSLNHKLARGINIGLNDRIAFIKHLFDGSASDYNRVLSQLNTFKTQEEVYEFIAQVVKPDYNNWVGKEFYETRFLDIIDKKFN